MKNRTFHFVAFWRDRASCPVQRFVFVQSTDAFLSVDAVPCRSTSQYYAGMGEEPASLLWSLPRRLQKRGRLSDQLERSPDSELRRAARSSICSNVRRARRISSEQNRPWKADQLSSWTGPLFPLPRSLFPKPSGSEAAAFPVERSMVADDGPFDDVCKEGCKLRFASFENVAVTVTF
jgi:hypothetical protein